MQNPSPIQRGLFVCGICSLLVSVLFSVNGFPAAELFAVIGGVLSVTLYILFQRKTLHVKRSAIMRHATFGLLVLGILLRSFAVSAGSIVFLLAFIAFLVWFTWSVLEELPPSED